MAAFEYQALNPQGHAVKGVMEGDAERQVRAPLRGKGVTPVRGDVIDQTKSARSRAVLAGVLTRVLEGQSLSRGLAQFPESFPDIFRSMVNAGEQSGKLDEVLERLADYTENRQNLQQKVLLAFIYPALVTLVAAAVVIGLLGYVVPPGTRGF